MPKVGELAPEFELRDDQGTAHRLSDRRGHFTVVYFYPADDTPGCTKEACSFRDGWSKFRKRGVAVLGVSVDDAKSHRKFIDKFSLPFPLLADTDARVCRAYGVLRTRERDGKTVQGIERTTFVIGKDGRIARVWPKVNVDGHVEDVLAFVRGS